MHLLLGPPPGTKPVHRFWNKDTGTHFYTMVEAERLWLQQDYSDVYIYEGPVFYAWPVPPDPNGTTVIRDTQ